MSSSKVSWQDATVVAVADAATGIRRIVLAPEVPVHAPPGAHVDVEVRTGRQVLHRSYSVVRSQEGGSRWTLGVRLSPTSRGGSRAMHGLRVGDRLRVTDPVQNFPLSVGAGRYVLLAGGIGVTALHAMGQTLIRRDADHSFVYVGRTRPAMAWLDDLQGRHGDRLDVHVDDEGTGLDVDRLVGDIASHRLANQTELYLCGPIRLMDTVRRAWARHGLPITNLRFETFGNSGSWEARDFTVVIPQDDVRITVSKDRSILEALERAGVEVMADCRKGECGLCTVRVREVHGTVDHRDVFLDDEQKASGEHVCLCVSRVTDARPTEGQGELPVLVIDRP